MTDEVTDGSRVMKFLRDDGLGLFRRREGRSRARVLGGGFLVLLVVAVCLFVFSVLFPRNMNEVRSGLESWAAPGLTGAVLMMAPVRRVARKIEDLSRLDEELQRLRQENQQLRGWQWRASELERKLKDLRALAKVVRNPGVGFVTAQVLSVSPGPRGHTIYINVGSKHGLHVGDAVINGDGLVGLVAQVTAMGARVSLLDDPTTRVNVTVGRAGVLAQIFGDHAGLARLNMLNSDEVVGAGDKVVTSGNKGGVPRGLKVGRVIREDGEMKVAPHATLGRLEYVSVLLGGPVRYTSGQPEEETYEEGSIDGKVLSYGRGRSVPARSFVETGGSPFEFERY